MGRHKSMCSTGLKFRTSLGQPDWDQVFYRPAEEHPYSRTDVFLCRPYLLGRVMRATARRTGFHFRMEQFYRPKTEAFRV